MIFKIGTSKSTRISLWYIPMRSQYRFSLRSNSRWWLNLQSNERKQVYMGKHILRNDMYNWNNILRHSSSLQQAISWVNIAKANKIMRLPSKVLTNTFRYQSADQYKHRDLVKIFNIYQSFNHTSKGVKNR